RGRRAELDGPLHVGHQAAALAAPEAEERDGHELAHLGRDMAALAERELVETVVALHELRVLPGRELPLRVHVAARRLHLRDQRLGRLRSLLVTQDRGPFLICRAAHRSFGSPSTRSPMMLRWISLVP